jgi:phage tail-like protein
MRAGVDNLCTPMPFIGTMPSVYWDDGLTEELCAAFDEVLAPVFATLDCLPAYLDPATSPADMLDWLAGWIGLNVAGREPAHKRQLIAAGAALLGWQGTAQSIHDAVVAAFNRETEVIESGSATWSLTPDSRPGGQPTPGLLVRVTVNADDDVDARSVDALVDAIKPAHIPHRIELLTRATQPAPAEPAEPPAEAAGA